MHQSKTVHSEPLQSPQTNSTCIEQAYSPETMSGKSHASYSYPSAVDWGQSISSELEGSVGLADPEISSLVQLFQLPPSDPSSHSDIGAGLLGSSFGGGLGSSLWPEGHESKSILCPPEQKLDYDHVNTADILSHKLIDTRLDGNYIAPNFASMGDDLLPNYRNGQLENSSGSRAEVNYSAEVERCGQLGEPSNEGSELKKVDSFGRWMDNEIGKDCDDCIMTSGSDGYWNTLNIKRGDKEVPNLALPTQWNTDYLDPSLSQQQLFSILDFAPDWADSKTNTTVLVVGSFMGEAKHFSDLKWCCMFGEIEVDAEALSENVLRCQTPSHTPGVVPFKITCSNRLACSEVREFEFRRSTSTNSCLMADKKASQDELRVLTRLIKLLSSGVNDKNSYCTVEECDGCKVMNVIHAINTDDMNNLGSFDKTLTASQGNSNDVLFRVLLKDKLYDWLACQTHNLGKGLNILDDEGQGVIHLAAALGFEWAIGPIIAAGISPNFRDAKGKTALHWASYYGREDTVIVLVKLGASAGSVDDPTPEFPGGQKAADLASSRGHKGIAGFLAETDLVSHLSLLTFNGSMPNNATAGVKLDNTVENAVMYGFPPDEVPKEEISLRKSLSAVRNSAHAASLIQDAFRVRSFRHKEMPKSNSDLSDNPLDLVALGCLSKVRNMHDFDDYLHSVAAIKIQQKYRGWKGRKEFLKIRKRIVNIQAHVRGHQVRKHYKKVVWSASILEKIILRWRRKRCGLRGYRLTKAAEAPEPDLEKDNEYDFMRIGRKQKAEGVELALARVQSMARNPEARDQYLRLVRKLEKDKEESAQYR
ncbi:calmodulin-binding transcription activator 1 isoform X2 [Daucus carota subsp. sativus]|nr:PREDICTED: calmodulin-binding transcription activator 1-like isoform X2 [Daucus carota subsp. sativus]